MPPLTSDRGRLRIEFMYRGLRCREYLDLKDTAANRKEKRQWEREFTAALHRADFDYATWFPRSKRAGIRSSTLALRGDDFPATQREIPVESFARLAPVLGERPLVFAAPSAALRGPVVYVWFQKGAVVYVGMSRHGADRPLSRWHHRVKKFAAADFLAVWACKDEDEAFQIEAQLIDEFQPILNQ